MKTHVVCIKTFTNLSINTSEKTTYGVYPQKGEIYEVIEIVVRGDYNYEGYRLVGFAWNDVFNVKNFRPTDDSFGEYVESTLMKEVELEEVLNPILL